MHGNQNPDREIVEYEVPAIVYAKKVNRQRLAEEAASLPIPEPESNAYSRTLSSGAGAASKK